MSNSLKLYPHLADRFFQESGRVRTPKSVKTYRAHLRALQAAYPNKGVTQFTTRDLTEFCLAGNRAPATINNKRAILSTFFSWATYAGLVKADPAVDLKWTVKPGKFGVRRHTWLNTSDITLLLKKLPADSLRERRDRVLVYAGLFTGLRLEGLLGLRWSSFTPDLATVRLVTKGQKLVEKDIPDDLLPVLHAWRRELAPHQGVDGPLFFSFRFGIDDELVPYYDVPLQEGGARTAVTRAGKLIDVELRPHDMRRSCASMLETLGFSIEDISRYLDHENISTTSNYMDRNPHRAKAAVRRIKLDL